VTAADHDLAAAAQSRLARERILEQIRRRIVGQDEVLDQLLTALFAGGHVLLVGVPGLAKTWIVRTLAEALSLQFSRIQFTPDLMPSDITGIEILHEDRGSGVRQLRFQRGPIFANVILADEINRTSPKTQAALLEAMQEMQVTVGGKKHVIDPPLFVLATQNPIEQEGTYPLPEALLDRFMFEVRIDYPSEEEELEIVQRTTSEPTPPIEPVLNAAQILEFGRLVRRVPVADHVARRALQLVRSTRAERAEGIATPAGEQGSRDVVRWARGLTRWGGGPRASQFMVLAAKARAVLHGRLTPSVGDIDAVATPVLRHRLRTNYLAASQGVTADQIIERLVRELRPADAHDGRAADTLFRSPVAE
jgi:MoxR-like ATPase